MANVFETEFDPLTGLYTSMGVEDGKFFVRYAQDVQKHMERNNALRNTDDYTKAGIKANMWHTVHIPDSVCLKMKVEDGFDPYTASARDLRLFLRKNRDKYGHLFVTRGRI